MFLGEDLLAWLMLALGGALLVGHGLALVRPPRVEGSAQPPSRPPLARSISFALIGLVAAVWALATLVSS
ncbi:MAG: hypothetical protein ACO3V0_08515 [Ilumatobacteraceae bacterium]